MFTSLLDIITTKRTFLNSLIFRVVLLVIAGFFITPASIVDGKSGKIELKDIRHRSGPNYTRVVLDLKEKAEFKYKLLNKDTSMNKPRRLYVDIKGAFIGEGVSRAIPVNDGLLKNIRTGQFDTSTVRVVLDIETLEDFTVFPLTNPFRIVIDVTGTGKKTSTSKVEIKTPEKVKEKKEKAKKIIDQKAKAIKSSSSGLNIIVLDPGHGGKDPGAVGKRKLFEKDVTLKIAKKVKKKLSKKLKAKIILTRTKDVFIPLDERTAIANSKDADLFVSIHVNASPNRKASGVETYYLGKAKDKEALRVSARENFSTIEEISKSSDILQSILSSMMNTTNRNGSIRVANLIQDRLAKRLSKKYSGIKSNGVKEALFYVLVKSNMPSVLVETSFISNPKSEKRLRTNKYIDDIAEAIAQAIISYDKGEGL